jgi:hypothetical protein
MGNLVEVFCPVLLSSMLVYIGGYIERYEIKDIEFDYMRHGLYPTLKANSQGEYRVRFEDIINQLDVLEPFFVHGGMGENGYDPLSDLTGPMNYFPVHCMPIESRDIYASTVIATIRQENVI